MIPQTFAAFLAWLLTAAGLSAATSLAIGALVALFADTGHALTDTGKRVLAAVVPFALVLAAWGLQGALQYVPWSFDNLYQALILAVELVAGSQAVYQGWKLARGA